MKKLLLGTTAVVAAVLVPSIRESLAQNGNQTGRISLQIANSGCATVSPQTSVGLNPNPTDINDNELDDSETIALQDGCTLRAIATDSAGNRVSGEELTLLRSEAPAGTAFPFGYPRTTDAQGGPTNDAGMGCQYLSNGNNGQPNGNNGQGNDSNGDFEEINPIR